MNPSVMAGLSRPSTSYLMRVRQDVDARDKPGHDEMAIGASHSLIQRSGTK
jgi:hypothetical protein